MIRTVLSVAYPFAPVGSHAVGGAEQVLSALDVELTRAGHQSIVIACEGSSTAGRLFSVPSVEGVLQSEGRRAIQQAVRRRIAEVLEETTVDLIHLHGVDFYEYLPPLAIPALVTLHLPLAWYPPQALDASCSNLHFNCVSEAQRRLGSARSRQWPVIENGVAVSALAAGGGRKGCFAVSLGRICPEKGYHLALEAAATAGIPMVLAGKVFPYESHQLYFDREIVPRLNGSRRFLGPVGFDRKRRLLGTARCLLVPSLVPETSSLVAMEAMACGTPVIAFRSGALVDLIDSGKTGFLVNSPSEMAEAIRQIDRLDPGLCRQAARDRFAIQRTVAAYVSLYDRLLGESQAGTRPSSPAPARGGVRAVAVNGLAALEALRDPWFALWRRCPGMTPFQSPQWLIPWMRHLHSGELWAAAVFKRDRLIGLLPGSIPRQEDAAGACLQLAGSGVSDYLDVLLDPDFQAPAAEAIGDLLADQSQIWRCGQFHSLPRSSLWRQYRPRGWQAQVTADDVCPTLALAAGSTELGDVVPPHQADNWKYYWKRAQRLGQVELEQPRPKTLDPLLRVFFDLHAARWKARGSSGVLAADCLHAFHREASAALLEAGLLRLNVLRIASRPVAAVYGFSHHKRFYYYLGGFDPEFASISPGTLLVGLSTQQAVREGAEHFNFLRGREAYKYLWGARDEPTFCLTLTPDSSWSSIAIHNSPSS